MGATPVPAEPRLRPWAAVAAAEPAVLARAAELAEPATPPRWRGHLPVAVGFALRTLETAVDLQRPELADADVRWLLESLPERLEAPPTAVAAIARSLLEATAAAVAERAPPAAGDVRHAAADLLARLQQAAGPSWVPAPAPIPPAGAPRARLAPPPAGRPAAGASWTPRVQRALDALHATAYVADRQLRLRAVNAAWDAFAEENGAPALAGAAPLGGRLLESISGSLRARWASLCRRLLAGDLPAHEEEIACHGPHRARVCRLRAVALPAPGGAPAAPPVGLLFTCQDVTDSCRAAARGSREEAEVVRLAAMLATRAAARAAGRTAQEQEPAQIVRAGELVTAAELARRLGTTKRAVEHAEARGLLRPAGRSPGGHKRYGAAEAERLALILALYRLGASAARIGVWLADRPERFPDHLADHAAWLSRQGEAAFARAAACAAQAEALTDRVARLHRPRPAPGGPGVHHGR